jgi:hypothetical protein
MSSPYKRIGEITNRVKHHRAWKEVGKTGLKQFRIHPMTPLNADFGSVAP